MSHPSLAYTIFIVPMGHVLGLHAHLPDTFGVGGWPRGHLCIPQVSQHTLLFHPGCNRGPE